MVAGTVSVVDRGLVQVAEEELADVKVALVAIGVLTFLVVVQYTCIC